MHRKIDNSNFKTYAELNNNNYDVAHTSNDVEVHLEKDFDSEIEHNVTQSPEEHKIEGVEAKDDVSALEETVSLQCSKRDRKPVEHFALTMKGKYHGLKTIHLDKLLNRNFLTLGGTILTQLSLRAGLTKWKDHGKSAISK